MNTYNENEKDVRCAHKKKATKINEEKWTERICIRECQHALAGIHFNWYVYCVFLNFVITTACADKIVNKNAEKKRETIYLVW